MPLKINKSGSVASTIVVGESPSSALCNSLQLTSREALFVQRAMGSSLLESRTAMHPNGLCIINKTGALRNVRLSCSATLTVPSTHYCSEMNVDQAALDFKAWAIKSGLMQRGPIVNLVAPVPNGQCEAVQPFVTAASQTVLSRKGISFIASDQANGVVHVYTHRKLTRAEQKQLPTQLQDGIEVQYRQGGLGAAGHPPGGPIGISPYHIHHAKYYGCGSSVHPANVLGAGTLGALVLDANGAMYGLTNNHVTGGCNFTSAAFPILAPGPVDCAPGGLDPFTIGHHKAVLPFVDGLPENVALSSNCDAAIFSIREPGLLSSTQRGFYDTPSVVGDPVVGSTVCKAGRTTGLTVGVVRGRVTGPEPITYVLPQLNNATKIVFFDCLYIVEFAAAGGVFASGGDSGALVCETDAAGTPTKAVGLVVGVNEASRICFVTPLEPILKEFNVTLVSGHQA